MRFHRGGRLGAAGQGRGAVMAHHFDVGEQRKFLTPLADGDAEDHREVAKEG